MSTMKFTAWQDLDGNEIANAAYPPGLVFIKSQTIGTAVSSVTVSDVFSSAFDNYRIILSNISCTSTDNVVFCRLDNHTSTTYDITLPYWRPDGTSGVYVQNGTNNGLAIGGTGANASSACDLFGPYLTGIKRATCVYTTDNAGGTASSWDTSTASRTGFTFRPSGGTMTGGTVRVYGYRD